MTAFPIYKLSPPSDTAPTGRHFPFQRPAPEPPIFTSLPIFTACHVKNELIFSSKIFMELETGAGGGPPPP